MRSRLDWLSINANLRLDRPLLLSVMRGQVAVQTTVAIQRVLGRIGERCRA